MIGNFLKRQLKGFAHHRIVAPLADQSRELVFQNLFDTQCRNAGMINDYYPVGAAAGYSLMYLLFRIFAENEISTVIELGSGQTTLLIDRIKSAGAHHVCYEHDPLWHEILKPQLHGCDYRLRKLTDYVVGGHECAWYQDVEFENFDLLLIDGPGGVERFSRLGAAELIERNQNDDFVIVFDDSKRQGEKETIRYVTGLLRKQGRNIKVNSLAGRTSQTVIASGKYYCVSYYY